MIRTLYLPVMIATAVTVACAVALSAGSQKSEAAFPGKIGRIAYNRGGLIYAINPDGSGKAKVTNTYVSGDDPDYSPDGKKIVYYTGNDLHGKIYAINVDCGGSSKLTEGYNPAWGSRLQRLLRAKPAASFSAFGAAPSMLRPSLPRTMRTRSSAPLRASSSGMRPAPRRLSIRRRWRPF